LFIESRFVSLLQALNDALSSAQFSSANFKFPSVVLPAAPSAASSPYSNVSVDAMSSSTASPTAGDYSTPTPLPTPSLSYSKSLPLPASAALDPFSAAALPSSSSSPSASRYPLLRRVHSHELRIDAQPLGAGNFGAVFRGQWRGAPVAIKRVKSTSLAAAASSAAGRQPSGSASQSASENETGSQNQSGNQSANQSGSANSSANSNGGGNNTIDWSATEAVLREAHAHESLKEHPNIVRFCGTCVVDDEVWLVSELCAGGSLRDAFESGRLQLPSPATTPMPTTPTTPHAVLTPEMRYGFVNCLCTFNSISFHTGF
jgi:hypothetical protein